MCTTKSYDNDHNIDLCKGKDKMTILFFIYVWWANITMKGSGQKDQCWKPGL
jgi:hypothetical protein